MMDKMIHGQVKNGNCLIQAQSHTQGCNQRFLQPYSRIDAHLVVFLLPFKQSDYGMAYPAVLLNPLLNTDLFKQHINFR